MDRPYLAKVVKECATLAYDLWNRSDYDISLEFLGGKILHASRAADALIPGHGPLVREAFEEAQWLSLAHLLDQAAQEAEIGETLDAAIGNTPSLRGDGLHPLVWDSCKSQWQTEHRRDAVTAAARVVNSRLQQRLNRRDVSEAQLVREAFSLDAPKAGVARLRLMPDDGSQTFKSIQVGAAAFGQGCFMAIRNPSAHEHEEEDLDEHLALEQLAAFSILARWIEDADVLALAEDPF